MDEIIMITTKKAIYMKRVVMEDLALMVSPQQRPQALGPRQQHNNSKQHIFSSPRASPPSFLTSDHVMLRRGLLRHKLTLWVWLPPPPPEWAWLEIKWRVRMRTLL